MKDVRFILLSTNFLLYYLRKNLFINIKKIINLVDVIAAQGNLDRDRFIGLGCEPSRIKVYGNIKYNIKLPEDLSMISDQYKNIL